MAISQLVSGGTATTERPKSQSKIQNERVEKQSSTMFEGSNFGSITIMLSDLTAQLSRINEAAKKIILGINKAIKSLKDLGKSIVRDFRGLNSEIIASRVDVSKLSLGGDVVAEGAPMPVAPTIPEIKAGTPTASSGPDVLGILAGLGLTKGLISALTGLVTFFSSPAGIALLAFAGGALVAYTALSQLTKAIMNDPDFKRMMERDFGKSDEELRRENAGRIRERNDPVGRQQRFANRQDAFKNNSWGDDGKPIIISQVQGFFKDENGNEIWTLKEKLKDGTKYINITTGERYLSAEFKEGRFQTTPSPAAPTAPTAPPSAPASEGSTGTSAPAATSTNIAPAAPPSSAGPRLSPAERSRQNRERAREEQRGTTEKAPIPPQTNAAPEGSPARAGAGSGDPLNPTTARHWMLNHPDVAAAYAKLSPTDKKKAAEMAAMGQDSEARNFVLSRGSDPKTLPAQMSTGDAQAVQGTEAQRAPSSNALNDRAQISPGAGGGEPAQVPPSVAGAGAQGTQSESSGSIGSPEKADSPQQQNTPGSSIVPTAGTGSSESRAAEPPERLGPELLRDREQLDRQQNINVMKNAEEMRIRGSVGSSEPIVLNNASTTNVGSSAGGETNNVSGQNLPMEVSNPALQPFIARQNVHYQ